ncbi:5'-AMP-activated protein kinase subunit gamma-like [Zerene cesonia]|uniref:5'-AMP-activated protein kinase subunit gamma-like n=1 Tax=Zerene cesonia TaxID=33412 RepID=UPI0018E52D68|nr:5'-AMP-activated protein kinase subunit gamma-like [Zerene cesonia]XP_038206332.1 5'-AMP-activated protein kinase subunit gamma-like [Zerene cesonia]XP_038206340.1 5'-AMP-activated protein kinase subunit gamma-like [Zerene cesonia]XP_038206348.1 5'-AMP-activated protein kinase subunit gamma-like [Zerene cesonia]
MDPILENESASAESPARHGKSKQKHKKKKTHSETQKESQTVVGERKKFVVTKLSATDDQEPSTSRLPESNIHTVHFGTRGAESHRPHVRSIFKEKTAETSRPSSAERDTSGKKEYETFHGTSTSPRSSIFDIFRIRRKSDSKKHQTLMQNIKAPKTAESPDTTKDENNAESKESHKKYYYTVTGVSSRKYSPITRVMDIFRSKPSTNDQPSVELTKKKATKQIRRSSLDTTSPTYHKNSYASLDPIQAKQLFREIRGLPKYDPYLSIVQISLGGRDKTRLLLNFFKYHRCYEILPKSAKVIIFDTQFLVRKTFPTLVSHGIRSAPLWDANKKLLVGMITVTDFIRILLHLDKEQISMDELETHTLHTWRRLLRATRKPLCSIGPDQSLHEAINLLIKHRVHRLLMIDPTSGDVLYILSHKRILRFLFVYLNEFPELTFFHKKIMDLNIGTYDEIISVSDTTSVKDAFQLLLDNNVSALPVLDENGTLVDVYAKYEVLNLVSEKLYSNLSISLGEVRTKKKDWEEKLQKCLSSITLYEALEVIVRTESHRLLLVNKDGKLVGIVSLSDILVYLNRIIPSEKKVSSLQEIFKPLEENKLPEVAKECDSEVISIQVPNLEINDVPEAPEAEINSANTDLDKIDSADAEVLKNNIETEADDTSPKNELKSVSDTHNNLDEISKFQTNIVEIEDKEK